MQFKTECIKSTPIKPGTVMLHMGILRHFRKKITFMMPK